jgi:hypothetical protein
MAVRNLHMRKSFLFNSIAGFSVGRSFHAMIRGQSPIPLVSRKLSFPGGNPVHPIADDDFFVAYRIQ